MCSYVIFVKLKVNHVHNMITTTKKILNHVMKMTCDNGLRQFL